MEQIRAAVMRYLRIFVSAGLAGMIGTAEGDPMILPLIPVISVVGKLLRNQIGKKFPNVAKWLPV